jgi:hypothetical protein
MRPHRTSSDAGISSWPARRSRPREGRLPGSASAKSCEPESADGVQWVVSYDVRVSDGAPEALGGRPDLVGRDVEEGRIAAFLASVPRGVRALVFRGEPGIGKTALWRRALEESRTAGHHVLVARPAEEEMSLALGALLDLFEHVPLDPAALQADENPLARGRMVLEALRQLAETRPVVVAIDDLQWIDSASARVLRFALRRLDAEPVGLLATVRVGADSEDPLAAAAILPRSVTRRGTWLPSTWTPFATSSTAQSPRSHARSSAGSTRHRAGIRSSRSSLHVPSRAAAARTGLPVDFACRTRCTPRSPGASRGCRRSCGRCSRPRPDSDRHRSRSSGRSQPWRSTVRVRQSA